MQSADRVFSIYGAAENALLLASENGMILDGYRNWISELLQLYTHSSNTSPYWKRITMLYIFTMETSI
jgi:hypothetical protein